MPDLHTHETCKGLENAKFPLMDIKFKCTNVRISTFWGRGLSYVGKIEIGKFVRIRTYMCISVHQLAGLFVGISNSPLDLQVAPSVSALTAIDRTNDTAYTDVC